MGLKIVLMNCPNPVLNVPTAHFGPCLLYVGGALKRAGHDVSIKDIRAAKDVTQDDVPEADIIGVTATSSEFHYAQKINKFAHQKGIKTMIGGAHATFLPEACYEFDYCIIGDGEEAALHALSGPLGRYQTPPVKLDGYHPDWDLIGEAGFSREAFTGEGYGKGPISAGLISSRGCPNRCAYCRERPEKVRFRPVDDVILELEDLKKRGIRHFRFFDENMTLNKERAMELFGRMEELNIRWRAHTRADIFDKEIALAAKAAGCEEMGFGFEAATDFILAKVRKNETVAQYKEAVAICKEAGILCKAFWMVGLPEQGWDGINDIRLFMAENKPDKWIVSLLAPYPGSDIWAHPDRYRVSWMEKDLSKYWNYAEKSTISYYDNDADSIDRQYRTLKEWLNKESPR